MTQPDYLTRPERPEASRHLIPPMPRYCLRQAGDRWYMIPLLYEWGFERYVEAWKSSPDSLYQIPGPADLPRYAIPVNLTKFTFEKPIELPD